MDLSSTIETAASWILRSRYPVFFAGPNVRTHHDHGLPSPWSSPPSAVAPGAGHRAIAELERLGKVAFLVSQGTSPLLLAAGFPPAKLAELRGNGRAFGETVPARELAASLRHTGRCDLFFALGSSLAAAPESELPRRALGRGALVLLLERGETPFDDIVDLRIWAEIGDVLPAIARRVRATFERRARSPR